MRPIVVKQGDRLSTLAEKHAFDALETWNHEANEQLRNVRENPEILCPGDVVQIPDRSPPPRLDITHGQSHSFRATVSQQTIVLVFADGEQPLANRSCKLTFGGRTYDHTTNDSGELTLRVPSYLTSVLLDFPDEELFFEVSLGHLDPISERSGMRHRLQHLGYAVDCDLPSLEESDRQAIRRFQQDQQLESTGVLDEATRDRLRSLHGS